MKSLIIAFFILTSLSFGDYSKDSSDNRLEKNIKKQLELEKKYSKDQTFYQGKLYNLKASEVDEKSVKSLPEQSNRNDDFDMDSVYD